MDRRATLLSIIMPPLVLASFILGFFARGHFSREHALGGKVGEAAAVVRDRYYKDVEDDKLEQGAMDGMMQALDRYCEYFTKEKYQQFHDHTMGNFFGVGIRLAAELEDGFPKITVPLKDTPAYAAGILPGDLILKVDGEDLKGKSQDDVVRRIKGPEGTKVVLRLRRKDKDFDVALVRAKITSKAVTSRMLDGKVGYVRISDFSEMLPQFDDAVEELRKQGMKGLIIDLRFNGGGLLESAVQLSDRFLPKGKKIVSTQGRQEADVDERKAKDDTHDLPQDLPVAILTNPQSASASEVFSGCLHDHERATLVGAHTFGKGLVQTPIRLSDGSYVKLTTQRYVTPKNTLVPREEGKREYGIAPDYLVELTAKEDHAILEYWARESIEEQTGEKSKVPADLQLDAAVEVINAKIENRPPKVEKREVPAADKNPSEP